MKHVKLAVIGLGYWGPNLVRNFCNTPDCTVVFISDLRKERIDFIQSQYPFIKSTTNTDEIFSNPEIDAVAIATPVTSHYDLARKALENGKHVLVEKPITTSSTQAVELFELAKKKEKVLMVDHTYLYTGAVQKMKQLISEGDVGKIKYFDSTRINLGLFQNDINVLWDLAPHDISILNYLTDEIPYSVNATGISHTGNNIENIAYLTINYKSGFIAHFNCSWTSPVKIRMMLIGGDKKMMVFNDLEPTDKVKLYDSGFSYKTDEEKRKIMIDYRTGDVHIPKIDSTEALFLMSRDFIQSILNNSSPVADFRSGLEVIRILEAADQSLKEKGKEIILK